MKKILLISITLVYMTVLYGQKDVNTFFNDELTSDASVTELIGTEPLAVSNYTGGQDKNPSDSTPETDLTASVEGSYSEYSKKINIPLGYRYRDYSFSVLIPYFMSKDYPPDFSVSGIGDISFGISYGKYLEQYSTYFDGNFTVKAPTGDPEADDGAAIISLGTDTWDFSGMVSAYYFREAFTYKASVLYKFNGELEKKSSYFDEYLQQEIDVTRTTDTGDYFTCMLGADFRSAYRLTYVLNMNYGIRFDSSTEEEYSDGNSYSYEDGETIFMDVNPSVKYSISLFEFVLGAKIPVYTDVPGNDSNSGKRSVAVSFRTNYKIF